MLRTQPELLETCEKIIEACENYPHRMCEYPGRANILAIKIKDKFRRTGKISFIDACMLMEMTLLTEKWVE